MTTPTAPDVAPLVTELQTLLNARGYGPIAVNGTMTPETQQALARLYANNGGMPQSPPTLQAMLEKVKSVSPPATMGVPPGTPFWKNPKFLWAAAGVAAVVGYVAYRAGAFDDELDAQGVDAEKALAGTGKKSLGSGKAACDRLPSLDFAGGTPISGAVPVTEAA